MSLSLALQTALTGLNASQKGLGVLSQNIANANTEGYTKKVVSQESLSLDGSPAGVKVNGIIRKVDEYLQRATRDYSSQAAASKTISDYFSKIQIYFGQPGTDNNLQSFVDGFFASLKNLSDTPDSASIRQSALNSATNMVNEINSLADSMQQVRFEADQEMGRSVTEVNNLIDQLHNVNISISRSFASGNPDSDLLDKRDILLGKMAAFMDIKTYTRESGEVNVYSANGVALLDATKYRLTYTPASTIDVFKNDTALSALQVIALNDSGEPVGRAVDLVTAGTEATRSTILSTGKIKGLVDIRDTEVPAVLDQLDEMASTLVEEFNKIHNDGVGFPPPTSLTGTRPIDSTLERDWTGSVRIAAIGQDGRAIPTAYANEDGGVRPLTLQLGRLDVGSGVGRLTVQDVVDEINANLGNNQKKVQIENMNDIRLVNLTENNPASLNMTFDMDLENISDTASQITILSVTPSSGATNSFPAGVYNVAAGEKIRTGFSNAIDITFGAAGVNTIDIDYQVVDGNGNTSVATIRYSVNTTSTDIKNDRVVGSLTTITSGTAIEKNPTNAQPYAIADIVDEDGNSVASGQPGFLRISVQDPTTQGIAIDELDSAENGLYDDVPPIVGTQRGLSHYFELNNFFVRNDIDDDGVEDVKGSATNLQIRADILANANFISTGELTLANQPADPTAYPYYSYEVGSGSNQVAARLAALAMQNMSFDSAGSLPSISKPFANYVGDIVASVAERTQLVDSNAKKDEYLQEAFQQKFTASSGVSLDEELGNTIVYQNAYTASARVITVVGQMLDTLLNSFGR